jgi:hypothetical protein
MLQISFAIKSELERFDPLLRYASGTAASLNIEPNSQSSSSGRQWPWPTAHGFCSVVPYGIV